MLLCDSVQLLSCHSLSEDSNNQTKDSASSLESSLSLIFDDLCKINYMHPRLKFALTRTHRVFHYISVNCNLIFTNWLQSENILCDTNIYISFGRYMPFHYYCLSIWMYKICVLIHKKFLSVTSVTLWKYI